MELIVLVDTEGNPIGAAEKLPTHNADTPLHLAFSCYVFNNEGKLLVTQRSHSKKVWPGVWSNSVCGHPFPNETFEDAILRRLSFELGMTGCDITKVVPKYTYQAPPYNGIVEHEFCPIFVARAGSRPTPNPDEVCRYTWETWEDYASALNNDTADTYSWWCKDQLKHLQDLPLIKSYAQPIASK